MNKDRLKNLILTTLIISAFFLTSQIWFNKKLWPDGYNFFGYAENLPIIGRFFNNTEDNSTSIEDSIAQLSVPYKAVVSNGGKREVFTPDQQEFGTITRMSFGVIDALFQAQKPEHSISTMADIKTALSDSSVFLTFEYDMDTAFIAGARRIEGESISKITPSFAHIVLTYDQNGNGVVYMCSSDNTHISRYSVANSGEQVKKILNAFARQSGNYAFAYELNLDKPEEDEELNQRLYLSSFVLVNVGVEEPEKTVMSSTPFADGPDQKIYDGIVESFGLEANRLRKAPTSYSGQKYIENSATITIYPDGTVTYNAVENQPGITADTTSDKIETVLGIVIRQWQLLFPETPLSLCVAENMTSINNTTIISFNYVINGKPVIFKSSSWENGITAQFNGDKLVNAKFNLRKLQVMDMMETPMPMLQNFDTAYEQLGINDVVTHAISCYGVKEDGLPMTSTLAITHSGQTGIIE